MEIKSGMATSEVAHLLQEKQMIDHAGEFESYLAEHGYEKAVQIGHFEVHSDMDFYEIAETITN
ncbi:endolytic transglycosylase MltG [Virgibacillus sp. MSP4-1]|nr:endolytic transglycosylase MltG [Virgibacillus sp. MSP4-1]